MNNTVTEVSLKYRNEKSYDEMPVITSPEKAARFLRSIWDQDTIELREEFVVVLLNNAKQVLGYSKISTGTLNATLVQPSTIFQLSILSNCSEILLAHNHPSGQKRVSNADIKLSKKLRDGGALLGIEVIDHIILTKESFTSLKDKGLF